MAGCLARRLAAPASGGPPAVGAGQLIGEQIGIEDGEGAKGRIRKPQTPVPRKPMALSGS
jgi:hypothetical protein